MAGAQGDMVAGSARLRDEVHIGWHRDWGDIPASDWDALLAGVEGARPFLRRDVLQAMVDSGSACADKKQRPR